jgi:hypothetical protein
MPEDLFIAATSNRDLALQTSTLLMSCQPEPHRHVLNAVDEIGPESADLAVGRDGGHPLGKGRQQHAQLERG